jgi:hypothetical protein
VRSFNRFEFKYIVRDSAARAFAAGLAGYAEADRNARQGGYPVHSVYWDSQDLRCFWEKLDGEKYRRKLRLRRYGESSQVFVEIKQRIDRTVQKRRTLLPLAEARRLFGPGGPEPGAESEIRDPVLSEALFLCRYYRLEPKMAVGYRREAFFGSFEQDLRITFDRRLQYDARALDPSQPFVTGKYMLSPDQVVLEIKFNHTVPLWLSKLARRHELELVRLSKYCRAIDQEFFGGRLT